MSSTYIAEEAAPLNKKQRRRLFFASSLGSFLEIFDFTIYGFFAGPIGEVFFKMNTPIATLFVSISVFGVGFVMRPLGSIVIGGYCDRHGRKAGLFATLILMGVGTAMIAFAPTYAMVGAAAPIILIVGRLIQGFSAGGQIGAASSLLLETAPNNQRGYFLSWQFIVQSISKLFSSCFAFMVFHFLSEEQLLSWGWRLPFLFSLLIIPSAFYIRKHIAETHKKPSESSQNHPFKRLMQNRKKEMLKCMCVILPCTVMSYVMVLYMPHYLAINHLIEEASRYLITAYASIILICCTLRGGSLCDWYPDRRRLIIYGFTALLLVTFCCFYFIQNLFLFLFFYGIYALLSGLMFTAPFLFIIERFSKDVRVTAIGSIYAITVTLFGGTAQMVVTALIAWSDHNLMAPFWYVGSAFLIGILGTWALKPVRQGA